ncbi:RadC family protein [Robbsia andropogonis]|uniref:RadC family protein n=1 Tax=Robbsia andropogonis TaxID=28092 RepID=UPI000464E07B|nr:DNA repair protein RadC [Robbsia andropogonis]
MPCPTLSLLSPPPALGAPAPIVTDVAPGRRATDADRRARPRRRTNTLTVVDTPHSHLAICDWPAQDRPRERLEKLGAQALGDAELLALFLRTGVRGRSAIDIARALLICCGSLAGVLQADDKTLQSISGIGLAKRTQLRAIQETVRRTLSETLSGKSTTLRNAAAVADYLRLTIGDRSREVFIVLFLDVHCRLLRAEEMAHGTVDRSAVYPREIARRALDLNATSLIVAHNHPSGVLLPSAADRALTRQLQQALGLLDIALVDHLIVSKQGYFSFVDQGMLP